WRDTAVSRRRTNRAGQGGRPASSDAIDAPGPARRITLAAGGRRRGPVPGYGDRVTPDPDAQLSTLGDDLVLLSVSQGGGRIGTPNVTGVGLMGAELVRLAASGRVDVTAGRVTVQGPPPTRGAQDDGAVGS